MSKYLLRKVLLNLRFLKQTRELSSFQMLHLENWADARLVGNSSWATKYVLYKPLFTELSFCDPYTTW